MFKLKFFITLIVLLCTTAFAQITGPKVGEVIGQMGTTWNEREGKTQNTSTGYELQMKDFLQTGEDGGMILNYADGTKFTMGPNTELTIDEFAFDTSVIPIELAMNVSVNVGTFTYESGKVSTLGGEVNISAGNAVITVQGTAFSGRVDTSGHATITLLPDSQGNVGQVTVSNDAGSQTITNAFSSVTVFGNDLAPTPPRIETDKRKIIQLDSFEEEIRDETERGFGDVDTKSSNAQNSEDAIFNEESNIVEDSNTIIQTDMSISESDSMIELESKEEKALEAAGTAAEAEIDTSYYDDYEEDLKDWGYIDEDNQISVWDADGESKMDWDDAKKMYAEMDQAYFDAIGCESGCNYDTIDWDSIDWDNVDWDAYDKAYNDTLEKYGLTSYNSTVEEVDVVEDTKGETEAGLDGYDWEDFMMDDNYYSNAEYKSKGGPPKLTVQNYCEYNGYEDYWCNQEYVDYLNDWYKNDWYLKVTATSWDTKSKDIFGKLFGWCGNWPDYKMCENQPKPWKMKDLKDKYITEWDYNDYNTYYDAAYDWWYTGYDYNNETDETNWEDEYAYEDNYDIDAELEILLASYDEDQCMKYGYFWSVAGQSCGTEWVDNEGNETKVTASGEILNYTTGDVTQTLTSSDTSTGASSSATSTGRVSTLNNDHDATASAADGFTTLNRYNDNHRAYVKTDTSEEADIQIIQDSEAQHLDVGTSAAQSNITIIQTN
jgi:hypothetical protein|tara:strand:+ start:1229 stop:3379 length:2151 start_codon:yes stop_codon:yes gene_type:complete